MIFAVVTAAVLIAMSLVLVRGLLGPTVYDRILAVNNFGTKTILMIALLMLIVMSVLAIIRMSAFKELTYPTLIQ